MPLWVIFTFINIVAGGTQTALLKGLASKHLSSGDLIAYATGNAALFLTPLVFYDFITGNLAGISLESLGFALLAISISVIANFFYVKALATNDLSLVGPLENLRPLIAIALSAILLSQIPTPQMLMGAVIIIIGAMILNWPTKATTNTRPPKRAVFFILIATALFALQGIVDKLALATIPPFTYAFFIVLSLALFYGSAVYFRHRRTYRPAVAQTFLTVGLLAAVSSTAILTALTYTTASEIISLQMLRSFYLAILGFVWFKEKGIVKKLIAGAIMVAGALIIVRS